MARIRTIKPEFWTNERVMECSANARLLFIGMWNFADDLGRLSLSPKTIKAQIFPSDEMGFDVILGMIQELSKNGLILTYEVGDKEYLQIVGWQHQRIDKPQPGKCPSPVNGYSKNGPRPVANDQRMVATDLILSNPTLSDPKKEARVAALDDGWPSDFREQFWNLYPHKIGKSDAIAKLERIRKRGVAWAVLMDGLRRYIATKPVDRPWCNPATWLSQARWEDQPAGSVSAQESQAEEGDAFWDAVLTSFKRFGVWSKHAGPDLESPACRVPAAMLAKHGLLRADEINPHQVPRLKSMGGLN